MTTQRYAFVNVEVQYPFAQPVFWDLLILPFLLIYASYMSHFHPELWESKIKRRYIYEHESSYDANCAHIVFWEEGDDR